MLFSLYNINNSFTSNTPLIPH